MGPLRRRILRNLLWAVEALTVLGFGVGAGWATDVLAVPQWARFVIAGTLGCGVGLLFSLVPNPIDYKPKGTPMSDKPGTDWSERKAAAGANAEQPQHESYTTADGPVQQHQHPMTDSEMLRMVEGE